MGLNNKQLGPMYQAWANNSVNAYDKAKERQQTTSENQLTRDAALAQLIRGKEMDHDSKDTMLSRQITEAERMRGVYGNQIPVNVEGVSIGATDPLAGLKALVTKRDLEKPQLTPAQETSEKKSGEKLSAWQVSGGSPAMQKHIDNQEAVREDLRTNKRDWYDRNVGGTVSKIPLIGTPLMSIVAPTEKARMDKAQGAIVQGIKAIDSAPTQVLIDQETTRGYDPSATNEQNAERVRMDAEKNAATKAQMEAAAANLQNTGYVMPGLAGQRTPAPRKTGVPGVDFNSMSLEQMQQMLKQLKEQQ